MCFPRRKKVQALYVTMFFTCEVENSKNINTKIQKYLKCEDENDLPPRATYFCRQELLLRTALMCTSIQLKC